MEDDELVCGSFSPNYPSFSTNAIHVGSEPERWGEKYIAPPICLSAMYHLDPDETDQKYRYARFGNPTRNSLEECLAKLEETKYCLVFPSGMSAITYVSTLVQRGDHVIAQFDIYHDTIRVLKLLQEEKADIELTLVDAVADITNIENALKPNTKLVLVESPTNPLLQLVDLEAVATRVKAKNPSTIVVCDNTIMTPYLQRPATLGVDVVINSCTKYLGGHADIILGAICTNNENVYEAIKEKQKLLGSIPSPFDCYLLLRSLKTLEIRMQKHMANGLQVVKFLQNHPRIEKVFYPGLTSNQQRELSRRQTYGHPGLISFSIKDSNCETVQNFCKKLKMITSCYNFGVTATSIKVPVMMASDASAKREMEAQGITSNIIRVSVGLENYQDIIDDLNQALSTE